MDFILKMVIRGIFFTILRQDYGIFMQEKVYDLTSFVQGTKGMAITKDRPFSLALKA